MELKEYPVFQEVKVDNVTSDSAKTNWNVNEHCSVSIDYGTSTVYGTRQDNTTLGTTGLFNLTELTESTTYHYRLTATNTKGDMSITDDASFCTAAADIAVVPVSQTGILHGQIMFYEGNFMPGSVSGTATPVHRQVFVFEKLYVNDSDLVYTDKYNMCFFTPLNKKVIGVTESDAITGAFEITLPAGEYTLCVWENNEYYANGFDGYGWIFPVIIKKDLTTEVFFRIDYKACY